MSAAVMSNRGDPISEPNLSSSASVLLNSPFDIELRKLLNTDIYIRHIY